MNNNTEAHSNFLFKSKKYISEKLKLIVIILSIIFLFFLSFQLFSYYKINNVKKNSIEFFNALDLNEKEQFYELMEELSNNNDFFSILSSLELVKVHLLNSDYELALNLYKKMQIFLQR